MAIIEVKMISGFYPDKESLRLLQKQHKPLQRYEVDNKNIYFYFNEVRFVICNTCIYLLMYSC